MSGREATPCPAMSITIPAIGKGENGSIIVIVLILLTLLTLAGISATNTSVTESFIVRNAAIHKQNVQLAEMAAKEGLRQILDRNQPSELIPGVGPDWIRSRTDWNNNFTVDNSGDDNSFPLTDDNSAIPIAVTNNDIKTINERGESGEDVLRYYFIGWTLSDSNTLNIGAGTPLWYEGRVIGIYNSDTYGFATVELGVLKQF